MDDTEIRIPTSTNEVSAPNNNTPDTISDSKSVLAYPADWMNSFGNNYYTQSQAPELTEFTVDKNWQTASESKPYKRTRATNHSQRNHYTKYKEYYYRN